jgi:hypothetical protein
MRGFAATSLFCLLAHLQGPALHREIDRDLADLADSKDK